ncbi:MAG: hypothetical protein RR909_03060 [Bacilli bacterium]
MQKQQTILKPKKAKLIIALIIIAIYIITFLIRLTPLVAIYEINFITTLIFQNTMNCLIIISILIFLYLIEKKMLFEKIEALEKAGK